MAKKSQPATTTATQPLDPQASPPDHEPTLDPTRTLEALVQSGEVKLDCVGNPILDPRRSVEP